MPAIEKILVPSDLSPEGDCAFEHARFLAGRFEASLTLYHAVQVPDHAYAHWAFAHGHEIWVRAEAAAREALARRAEGLAVKHEVVVERAVSAPRAVLALIRSLRPDVTVMATHGREGLRHLLLGSVTEKVFRTAGRPVLCVREPAHGARLPYRRILVPTDVSLASRLAFPMAALLARSLGAEIVGVYVVPETTASSLVGVPHAEPVVVPTEAALWKFLEDDFAGLAVTAQVHRGTIWDRIVHTASVEKADLIVMATRGHDSLGDTVMGSNTERVVRHSPCPVLVA